MFGGCESYGDILRIWGHPGGHLGGTLGMWGHWGRSESYGDILGTWGHLGDVNPMGTSGGCGDVCGM